MVALIARGSEVISDLLDVFFFPSSGQIHWPIATQRKTECILSGKDTNVSISSVHNYIIMLLHVITCNYTPLRPFTELSFFHSM